MGFLVSGKSMMKKLKLEILLKQNIDKHSPTSLIREPKTNTQKCSGH